MVDRRKLKGWKRFQPTADDPLKYRIPNPKSTPKEIFGSHGHRPHGKSILWPALYEHLRRKGKSKAAAAAISNAAWKKKRLGIATNTPTSARGIAKTWCPDLHNDGDTIAILKSGVPDFGSDTVTVKSNPLEETVGTKITKDDLPQEVVDYIDALEDHIEEQDGEIAKMADDIAELRKTAVEGDVQKDDADLSVILEKADPAVAAVIRKQAEDLAKAQERIDAQAQADLNRTMVAKAERLPMITTDKDDLANVLKTAYGVSTEFGEQVEKMLSAANEQITKSNLFTDIGTSGIGTTVSGSVESKAAELRKSDPTLTQEQAIARVYETNPDLYEESLKEG